MASCHHVVHVHYQKDKCNLYKLQADLERRGQCRVQKREHHRRESNTEVFFLSSAEDVDKVMARKEKFETKHNVTLHREEGKSADVRPSATDKSKNDSSAVKESRAFIRAIVPQQESHDRKTPHHCTSALDVPSKEVVPLQPWEIKLLRLKVLEELRQSLPEVEMSGDKKTQEMYLLGPREAVEAFKTKIHTFLKALQSQEWKCSDELSSWLGAEAGKAYMEKEFERKNISAVLSIQSSETSSKQVWVWGSCQDDVKTAILELDAMLKSVTLPLTPELEARLRDHEDEDSAYNCLVRAQGLVEITVEPHNNVIHLTGLAAEVEWMTVKMGVSQQQTTADLYSDMSYADSEGGGESICPDLPLCLRRLLHRHQHWLRAELKELGVEVQIEMVSGSPCFHLSGSEENCELAQKRLNDMKDKVTEGEFEVPDLAIVFILDTREGLELLAELEDNLHIIFDINKNRTMPDTCFTSSRQGSQVDRVIYGDGSYVFKLKNEPERGHDIYEDVEDFFQLGKEYEDSEECKNDDTWTEEPGGVELPERKEGLHPTSASRQHLPDHRDDNYVKPSSLGRLAKKRVFEVTATSGDDRVELMDATNKLLRLLLEQRDLLSVTSGADVVVNFVVDGGATSGCISSLVTENHQKAIQEELRAKGEKLKSAGLAEGDAVGELGCGGILHVEVRAGSKKVTDAVSRALSYADQFGHRGLVMPVQGLVDFSDVDQVAQLCEVLEDFASKVPEAIKEVKLFCPDACAVSRIRDSLSGKAVEDTYGDVTLPVSDKAESTDLAEPTWEYSELTGTCNKELRSVFLRVTYMEPCTLREVIERLQGKMYRHILAHPISHSFIPKIYDFQWEELFRAVGDNVLVVVQKKDKRVLFLGSPEETPKASNAAKDMIEQFKKECRDAYTVEWGYLDNMDSLRSPKMDENCRWERSWKRDCHSKRPHFKVKLESGMHMVNLDALRIFPFSNPDSWMHLLRVDKEMALPDEWKRAEEEKNQDVPKLISVGSQEYDHDQVTSLLKGREVKGHKFSLIKVELVRNEQQWRQFQALRHQVAPPGPRRRRLSRLSLFRRKGPDFHLWCDVSSAEAKDILILGFLKFLRPGEHSRGHGGLQLFSTPRRAVEAALPREHLEKHLGKERVLVQVEAVAPCLQRKQPGVTVPSLQNLPTCLVDNPRNPHEFLLASHLLTYPRLFATYRLVKS